MWGLKWKKERRNEIRLCVENADLALLISRDRFLLPAACDLQNK